MKPILKLSLLFAIGVSSSCRNGSTDAEYDSGPDIDSNTGNDSGADGTSGLVLEWAVKAGGAGNDTGKGLFLFTGDSVFLTGSIGDDATFGSGDNKSLLYGENGHIYVMKLSSDGTIDWIEQAGGGDSEQSVQLFGASHEFIVATGFFEEISTWGRDSHEMKLTSNGHMDMFAAKYNVNGRLLWATSGGGPYVEQGTGVSLLKDKSIVVVGTFGSSAQFGTEDNMVVLDSDYEDNVFLLNYSSNGLLVWARTAIRGTLALESGPIVTLPDDSMIVIGRFVNEAIFGEGESERRMESTGEIDGFIAKFRSNGLLEWVETSDKIHCNDIAVFSDGSFVIAGSTNTTVTKFSSDGSLLWERTPKKIVADKEADSGFGASSIAVLPNDTVVVAGVLHKATTFSDGDGYSVSLEPESRMDLLIAMYDNNGQIVWVEKIRGNMVSKNETNFLFVNNDIVGTDDSVFVTGYFNDQAVFGKGNNEVILESEGGYDIFIAKYRINGK